jgi:hypothetical protein
MFPDCFAVFNHSTPADVFDVFIRLVDDAEYGLFQSGGTVVNYGNNRY